MESVHHDGERAVDGLGLAAGDRGVQHFDAVRRDAFAQGLGIDGVDGAHIDEDGTGLHVRGHAVFPQHDSLDLGAVGEHRDDHVAALCHFDIAAGPGARGNKRLALGHVAVGDRYVIARFHEIQSHGLAHDTHSDKTDFHIHILLFRIVESIILTGTWTVYSHFCQTVLKFDESVIH